MTIEFIMMAVLFTSALIALVIIIYENHKLGLQIDRQLAAIIELEGTIWGR